MKKISINDIKEIFAEENLDPNIIEELKVKTKEKLIQLSNCKATEYKIPSLHNVIHFTSKEDSKELKPLYIKKYIASHHQLYSQDNDFKFYFWTNNESVVPEEITTLPNVEIKNIFEFESHVLYPNLTTLINAGETDFRKYVEASDINRIMIQQKYGGIYQDTDYEIYNGEAIIQSMKCFDSIIANEFNWTFRIGNAFFANSPNHPIIKEMERIVKRNLLNEEGIPEYLSVPLNKFHHVLMQTGPVAMTIAALNALDKDSNNDIIYPPIAFYNYKYARHLESHTHIKAIYDFSAISSYDDKTEQTKQPSVCEDFLGIEVCTIGADMFSASWGIANNSEYFRE